MGKIILESVLDDTKKEFDGMELGIGEVIKIQYFNNEREQNVIVKIEKMKCAGKEYGWLDYRRKYR